MKAKGGCHCGNIQFEVTLPSSLEVEDCNCSICNKTGFLHLIVPMSSFTLLSAPSLSEQTNMHTYTFNSGVAQHYFCEQCGIKPFYIPRSNPDGIDVNWRCLENVGVEPTIVKFDGQNWEQNAASLAHKSQA